MRALYPREQYFCWWHHSARFFRPERISGLLCGKIVCLWQRGTALPKMQDPTISPTSFWTFHLFLQILPEKINGVVLLARHPLWCWDIPHHTLRARLKIESFHRAYNAQRKIHSFISQLKILEKCQPWSGLSKCMDPWICHQSADMENCRWNTKTPARNFRSGHLYLEPKPEFGVDRTSAKTNA